jgi:ethanolamine ammonia-lyase large subunit
MSELRQLLTLAGAFKEGDLRVGGSSDPYTREQGRRALAAVTLGDIHRAILVDDGVTAALVQSRDRGHDGELNALTVADAAAALLSPQGARWATTYRDSLSSEAIAAIAKIMSDDELSSLARTLFNPVGTDRVAIGGPAHFGSRIQPNSPGDAEDEILFSTLDGLAHGCGDVILGLNPAADNIDTIVELEQLLDRIISRLSLPTRFCVLSDIVKQHAARQHTRIDVGFQSLGGTSRALVGMVGLDVDGLLELARAFSGLYFETGQGSEVTNSADVGVDMVTLEARTYGVARFIRRECGSPWTIVNDVAGFIGPEVFKEPEQLYRACLEDAVMAKLHGLTMGLDVCATFHMGISPSTLRSLTKRMVERAAPAYLMAVAGNADPMLGYLTTSFREHPQLRQAVGRRTTESMQSRLTDLGVQDERGQPVPGSSSVARLYSTYARAGGDSRSSVTLEEEAMARLHELRERGFDLSLSDAESAARIDRIYSNARAALYADLEDSVVRDACPHAIRVRTTASSREHYLAAPEAGERIRPDDLRQLEEIGRQAPEVLLVISDGLNPHAVNEQLRAVVPLLRRVINDQGHHLADTVIVVRNGRVRAGYEIGGRANAMAVIHLIGERPGTGLNMLSAYITYGRDAAGASRWAPTLDHSATTAICGIHPKGKPPGIAAVEIATTTHRILESRRSGVLLKPAGPAQERRPL